MAESKNENFDLGIVASVDLGFSTVRHEPAYPLTADEQAIVAAAPFQPMSEGWKRFAWSIHDCVVHSYEHGEIDFRRMMELLRNCSLGCSENDRVELLALTADRALRISRRTANRSAPPFPPWQRKAVIDLLLYLESLHPDRSDQQNRTTALEWLRSLGLATENTGARKRPLSTRTIERWLQDHRILQGIERPKGRPSR